MAICLLAGLSTPPDNQKGIPSFNSSEINHDIDYNNCDTPVSDAHTSVVDSVDHDFSSMPNYMSAITTV
jgi:hypothetical protein